MSKGRRHSLRHLSKAKASQIIEAQKNKDVAFDKLFDFLKSDSVDDNDNDNDNLDEIICRLVITTTGRQKMYYFQTLR